MKKNNIAFIGAGRIANSLALVLKEKNYYVNYVLSKKIDDAEMLGNKLKITNFSDSLNDIPSEINTFFLSVPDDQLTKVVKDLSKLKRDFTDSIFIHLSGAKNISILNPLKRRASNLASIHIMQTFPNKRFQKIAGCYAALESSNELTRKFLINMASELKLKYFFLKPEEKIYYHIAGVFVSNFMIANFLSAQKVFEKINIKESLYDIVEVISHTTLQNIINNGASDSLSGPVKRGDIETIRTHIRALKKIKSNSASHKELLHSYILNSIIITDSFNEKSVKSKIKDLKLFLLDELSRLSNN